MRFLKHILKGPLTLEEGKEQEIEVPLPDGYLTSEEVSAGYVNKDAVDGIVKDRLDRDRISQRKHLLADDEFVGEIIQVHNLKKAGEGDPEAGEQIERAKKAWETEHVQPLKDDNDALKIRVGKLLNERLHGEIIGAAAEAGVKPAMLKRQAGGDAMIVSMIKSLFRYDEKSDTFAVIEGEGLRYSPNATEARPYAGPEEFLQDWAKAKENADFLAPQRQDGAGLKGDQVTGEGATIKLSREEAEDAAKYRAALKQADETGGRVEVVDSVE